jgi:hypothetical protein
VFKYNGLEKKVNIHMWPLQHKQDLFQQDHSQGCDQRDPG